MEWSAEGYQLWLINKVSTENNSNPESTDNDFKYNIVQLDFVKSALTVNPCMVMNIQNKNFN